MQEGKSCILAFLFAHPRSIWVRGGMGGLRGSEKRARAERCGARIEWGRATSKDGKRQNPVHTGYRELAFGLSLQGRLREVVGIPFSALP